MRPIDLLIQKSGVNEWEARDSYRLLYEQQIRDEMTSQANGDRGIEFLREFHAMVSDVGISAAAVAEFANNQSYDGEWMKSVLRVRLTEEKVIFIRSVLNSGYFAVTELEPPGMVFILCQATYLLSNTFGKLPEKFFIIGSSLGYRSGGVVTKVNSDVCSILLSRNLIFDAYAYSQIISVIGSRIRNSAKSDIGKGFSTQNVQAVFRSDALLREILCYQLASTYHAQRLAVSFMLEGPGRAPTEWRSVFFNCMISFLIGHELGHVFYGHLGRESDLETRKIQQGKSRLGRLLGANPGKIFPHLLNVDAAMLQRYLVKYAARHEREYLADQIGTQVAFHVGNNTLGCERIGLLAASTTLNLLSWLDRRKAYLSGRGDPQVALGQQIYSKGITADILFPRSRHPWGSSRRALMLHYVNGVIPGNCRSYLDVVQCATVPVAGVSKDAIALSDAVEQILGIHPDLKISVTQSDSGTTEVSVWNRGEDGSFKVVMTVTGSPIDFGQLAANVRTLLTTPLPSNHE